jgi:hypothetical protein
MIADIERILRGSPAEPVKNIARLLNSHKTVVNPILYGNRHIFSVDTDRLWSLVSPEKIRIRFTEEAWVDCRSFEQALATAGSPLDFECTAVDFVLPVGCKLMVDAAARVLALCNQLILFGKSVSIDFTACSRTRTYLNRLGFFEHLNAAVQVVPRRPSRSAAEAYRGNNDGVIELAAIHHQVPDESIPKRFKKSLVTFAGARYEASFTFISELFGNVRDHAQSRIPGFAALQYYPRSKKVQTVISDSGVGIVGSLMPVLAMRNPGVFKSLDLASPDLGPQLLLQIFKQGRISRSEDDARGLGLKVSGEVAAKFDATVTIRQQNFELTLVYGKTGMITSHRLNLPSILGTHICVEFLIDS